VPKEFAQESSVIKSVLNIALLNRLFAQGYPVSFPIAKLRIPIESD